ncbi:hypothetical protein V2P75_26295, partial [Bordetella bronchiseptica]
MLQNFYGRWFEESLAILERHGFLQQMANGYAVTRSTEDINELWNEWDEKKADLLQDSNMKAMVVLVETALK